MTTACLFSASCVDTPKEEKRAPNIIFILSDDISYGDLDNYGQQKIKR